MASGFTDTMKGDMVTRKANIACSLMPSPVITLNGMSMTESAQFSCIATISKREGEEDRMSDRRPNVTLRNPHLRHYSINLPKNLYCSALISYILPTCHSPPLLGYRVTLKRLRNLPVWEGNLIMDTNPQLPSEGIQPDGFRIRRDLVRGVLFDKNLE